MKIGEHRGFDRFMDWVYLLFGLGLIAVIFSSGWVILNVLKEL